MPPGKYAVQWSWLDSTENCGEKGEGTATRGTYNEKLPWTFVKRELSWTGTCHGMKSGVSLKANVINQQCRQIAFYFLKNYQSQLHGQNFDSCGAKEWKLFWGDHFGGLSECRRELWLCFADSAKLSSQIDGSCKILRLCSPFFAQQHNVPGLVPYPHWWNYCH